MFDYLLKVITNIAVYTLMMQRDMFMYFTNSSVIV